MRRVCLHSHAACAAAAGSMPCRALLPSATLLCGTSCDSVGRWDSVGPHRPCALHGSAGVAAHAAYTAILASSAAAMMCLPAVVLPATSQLVNFK